MAYTSIKTADLKTVKLSETTKQTFANINDNSTEEETRATNIDAKFEALEGDVAGLQTSKEDAFTDGSATIASVSSDVVTLKAGVAQSGGAISNSSGADITLAKVAKTGDYNDLVSNKPTLGTAAAKDFTTSVTSGSADLVTSGAVYTAIENLPEPMIFKGTLGTGGTTTSLPTAAASNEGFVYKVITDGTYASQAAKVGDTFICANTGSSTYAWVLIPSGDDVEDTWRQINVNGTELLGNGISTGAVNFKNGGNITVTGSGNDITLGVASGYSIPSTTDQTSWTNKMDKVNPTGSGSVSIGRKANTTVGANSVAIGEDLTASGGNSVALGYSNTASGSSAFVEGQQNTSSGTASHAEGILTSASGNYSHAEGEHTSASGRASHAGGYSTTAGKTMQVVYGEYNVVDNESDPLSHGVDNDGPTAGYGRYIEIIGNGKGNAKRSNARTLDWNGNERLAGGIILGNHTSFYPTASSDITLTLPTTSGTLALTSQIPSTYVSTVNGQSGAVTGIATETYVNNAISNLSVKGSYAFTASDSGWTSTATNGVYTLTISTQTGADAVVGKIPFACFNSSNEQVMATLSFNASGHILVQAEAKFAGTVYAI